jgi:hypothetical protein
VKSAAIFLFSEKQLLFAYVQDPSAIFNGIDKDARRSCSAIAVYRGGSLSAISATSGKNRIAI